MQKLTVTIFTLFAATWLFGQSKADIDLTVKTIDTNSKLEILEFDANEIYEQVTDGGGIFKIYRNNDKIEKIEQNIGLSFGSVTTTVYLNDGEAIKIIDTESNFVWLENESTWDYTKLEEVFRAEVYVFDWRTDSTEIVRTGKRNLSEGTCGLFEFEPLIQLANKLASK